MFVGFWEGGVGFMVGFVFGRIVGFGRRAGGFSCIFIRGVIMGLKVFIVLLEEFVFRRIWGFEFLRVTLCKGLRDFVEVVGVGEFFICFRVFSITSGVCLVVFCFFSFRSLFKVVFIVFLIFCCKIIRERYRVEWWWILIYRNLYILL